MQSSGSLYPINRLLSGSKTKTEKYNIFTMFKKVENIRNFHMSFEYLTYDILLLPSI